MVSSRFVILFFATVALSACVTKHDRDRTSRIVVSDGVHIFDSAAESLTRDHCHKPDETIRAKLPPATLAEFIEEARQTGLFGEPKVFPVEGSEDGEILLERICVGSYVPPYRLRIESGGQVFDETWNRCPPHENDDRGQFLHEAPAKVMDALIVDERESFSKYDCGWR